MILRSSGIRLTSPNSIHENESLGESEIRVYAPETATTEELFVLRIELELSEFMPVATPMSGATPASPLRDTASSEAYTYLGAELRGLDLLNFNIYPQTTAQILRLDPDGLNYWEWELRATDAEAIGTRYLQVFIYAPVPQSDGSLGQIEVYRQRFSVDIVPAAEIVMAAPASGVVETPADTTAPLGFQANEARAFAPTSMPIPETVDPAIRVIFNAEDSLIVHFLKQVDVSSLRLRSSVREEWVGEYPSFALMNNVVNADTCLQYKRFQSSSPVPRSCRGDQTFTLEILDADIFWYTFFEQHPLELLIYYDEQFIQSCVASMPYCDVDLDVRET